MKPETRDAALDAWARADCTLREIAARLPDANYNALRSLLERARLDDDPRAISNEEHHRRLALHRRPVAAASSGPSLAARMGIRIGQTICRVEYSLTGYTSRENLITLSGGHARPDQLS